MKYLLALILSVLIVPPLANADDDVDCPGCVDSRDLAAQSIHRKHIAPKAVGTGKIKDGAVTADKLSDGAVGYDQLDGELQSLLTGTAMQPYCTVGSAWSRLRGRKRLELSRFQNTPAIRGRSAGMAASFSTTDASVMMSCVVHPSSAASCGA